MDPSQAAHALARASATLTDGHDVAGTLVALLRGCRDALGADAAGILIHVGDQLELLSASSHEASELETHQTQLDEGPCVDAYTNNAATRASGASELIATWPTFGSTMIEAGFGAAHGTPLRWHHGTVGAMGLFRRTDQPFTTEDDIFAQAFADIAAMLIIHSDELATEQLHGRLQQALSTRVVIEQAKGVLAEQRGLDMAQAYESLVQDSIDRRTPLADWAATVVADAVRR